MAPCFGVPIGAHIARRAKEILDRGVQSEVDRLQREVLNQLQGCPPKGGRVSFKWHGLRHPSDKDEWPYSWSDEY